jgi:hypothetical protein
MFIYNTALLPDCNSQIAKGETQEVKSVSSAGVVEESFIEGEGLKKKEDY